MLTRLLSAGATAWSPCFTVTSSPPAPPSTRTTTRCAPPRTIVARARPSQPLKSCLYWVIAAYNEQARLNALNDPCTRAQYTASRVHHSIRTGYNRADTIPSSEWGQWQQRLQQVAAHHHHAVYKRRPPPPCLSVHRCPTSCRATQTAPSRCCDAIAAMQVFIDAIDIVFCSPPSIAVRSCTAACIAIGRCNGQSSTTNMRCSEQSDTPVTQTLPCRAAAHAATADSVTRSPGTSSGIPGG